jgi:predicted negative regulator of RcsB-dependent stress response
VRSYTRHQLKEDGFATATKDSFTWMAAHGRKLTIAGVIVLVIAIAAGLIWFQTYRREQQASVLLGKAMRTYHTFVRPPDMPAQPGVPSFESADARNKAAQADFRAVVDQYGSTRQGAIAKYYLGLVARDSGNAKEAETYLKEIAGNKDRELSALAKFALASMYRGTEREPEGVKFYQELIAQPTASIPKETAQLELALAYEDDQPGEAVRIYEQLRTEKPASPAAQIATARLGAFTPR